ncbi:MAG: DHA2 family efflux MFS transporter permease subunit [Candidatus Omnitrophica bacterium]|nr:DHA2 family efflux MFS transporter permease subunit [Candidatus Omnitrophota bacterium]MDD5652924.1 DHA2 family efflux MFS transporter permease subunit [Candidatus Omnitrophota bacterium]
MNKASKWIIALAVVLPTLLEVIDTSVVNVSLDHIRGSLSAGIDEATWAITAYLVSNAIIIPMTGWLSSVFGRKRYLIFSVVLFTISSFMCGSATSLAMLVFFRIVQGIGGGALQPISQTILLEAFPPAEYGMAMALFGVGVMFGPIVGPVLGGWITDNWSWNWIFYINIPIGILSVIMIMMVIQDPPYLKKVRKKIDYWGIGLVTVGIGCLQVILDKGQREDWFSSAFITRLAIIAFVSLVIFVIVELRSREPILNLRELKDISFASANIIQSCAFFVLFGSILLMPLFVQQLLGYNSFLSGMALAPGGVATLIAMPITGKLISKVSPKAVLAFGQLITAYSIFTMSKFNLYIDFYTVALSRILMGVGMAMVFVPLSSMAFSTIKKEEMGNATSIFSLLRNISGSFGVAIMTTLLARRAQFHQFRLNEALNPFDLNYQMGLYKSTGIIGAQTGVANGTAAKGLIYQQMLRQSVLFSFTDAFYFATLILLCIIPLIFLLKESRSGQREAMVH